MASSYQFDTISALFKRAKLAKKTTNKKLKMNLKILAVALSMVAAQSNNPGVDVSGSAAKMHADYEKMPVERQRRFWVGQARVFLLNCMNDWVFFNLKLPLTLSNIYFKHWVKRIFG